VAARIYLVFRTLSSITDCELCNWPQPLVISDVIRFPRALLLLPRRPLHDEPYGTRACHDTEACPPLRPARRGASRTRAPGLSLPACSARAPPRAGAGV